MEQTCSSKEVISHACKLGKQYFETRECDEMSNVPMNHQGKVIACTSKQVYSGGQFMLFEESPLLGDELSDTDCKIHRRQNDIHFGVSQNKNGGKAGSIEMAENSATLNCRQNKEDQMKLYEDLGLEYCNIRHNSSGNPSDQEKVGISEIPKSEVMKMVATIYEPLSYKARCSLIHEHHLGDASFVSDSFSGQGMDKEIMPAATSADDLNTICLKGCKDMNTGNIGEKRFCAFVQRPDYASYVKSPINKKSSCNDGSKSLTEHDPENQQGIHNENQFCNTEVKSQIDSEEFVMDTLALNNNAVQIYKDVHILQEQSPTTESTVFHTDDLEDSSTDASEDSFYTVYSTNSIDDNFQSDAMLKFFKLTSSIKVNQSVDVTSDFRDCCTSSKATCVETSVVSRGNNTEISLYNSYVVKEWESESCRSVGCNTDKSYIREEVQEVGCQTIWVDAQENPIVADLAPVEITSLIQGSLRTKINEYSIDLKEPADGNFTNEKTELVSSLFTSLAELEARYKIMKEKLLRGTSLEALLPLFMEVNTKTTDVPYTPSMLACNSDNNSPFQNISSIVLEGAQCQENEKNDVKVISPMNESKEQFYVHVGSLHPSVSEAEVRSLFQRYDVSEVLIHEYSTKKSFAFLTFKTARQAEMAVEEMDGKHIHGKNIKVCLIQVAREAVSSTVGTSPILPSPEHKVIFGKNIEEKVVSSTSPGFSVLPDSSTTDLTIAPNLMTVVSSDPNVSGMGFI
ncbi:RNA-binding protein 44 [Microcaecilia unicolor]|uniref:RNA-binding protein 44 n=1 Tax=Microcaecilia unicolor TaxID=1415580 RepID=A0A6P7YR39_9AMPH|nr:RNA-binding protein 44 [Microcaecilia unicolor]